MDSPSSWTLHPQLEGDTCAVGDLPLSRLLLANDANYSWLLLVPRRFGASEIIDLSEPDQIQLTTEIAGVSRALKAVTSLATICFNLSRHSPSSPVSFACT